jgi:formamidopyrimidine-DNA glycosylase
MPELPEVETVCRGLAPVLEGRVLTRVEQRIDALRWPLPKDFARRIEGNRVTKVARRAKYILIHLDGGPGVGPGGGEVIIAHLGMSGRMTIHAGEAPSPQRHDHIVFHTDDDHHIVFNDARRFGMMDLVGSDALDRHPLLAKLGAEPLGNEFNGRALAAMLKGKRTPIKAALLDQSLIAGIGNIYACEILYRARLSPKRMAYTVAGARVERVASAVRSVLTEAIEAGGSSLRDYVQTSGELGYFQHHFAVYDHEGEPCPGCDCDGAIRRIVQSGRSSFYCPRRQR